jgi:hypothetical protein
MEEEKEESKSTSELQKCDPLMVELAFLCVTKIKFLGDKPIPVSQIDVPRTTKDLVEGGIRLYYKDGCYYSLTDNLDKITFDLGKFFYRPEHLKHITLEMLTKSYEKFKQL